MVLSEPSFSQVKSQYEFSPKDSDLFTDRFAKLRDALDNNVRAVVEEELTYQNRLFVYQSHTVLIDASSFIMQHMSFEMFKSLFLHGNLNIRRTKDYYSDLISLEAIALLMSSDPRIVAWLQNTASQESMFQMEVVDVVRDPFVGHFKLQTMIDQLDRFDQTYKIDQRNPLSARFRSDYQNALRIEALYEYFVNYIYPKIDNPGIDIDVIFDQALDYLQLMESIKTDLNNLVGSFNQRCFEKATEPENPIVCQSPFSDKRYTRRQLLADFRRDISDNLNYVIENEELISLTGAFGRTVHLDQGLHRSSDCIYSVVYEIHRLQLNSRIIIQLVHGQVTLKTWSLGLNQTKSTIVLDRESLEKILQENISLLR